MLVNGISLSRKGEINASWPSVWSHGESGTWVLKPLHEIELPVKLPPAKVKTTGVPLVLPPQDWTSCSLNEGGFVGTVAAPVVMLQSVPFERTVNVSPLKNRPASMV